MFKSKITNIEKGEDGFITTFKVSFTNGTINVESSFDFKHYGFKTDDDIFNFLLSESAALDARYAEVAHFEALVGVDDVADVLKTRIDTAQKEKEASDATDAATSDSADTVVTP